MTLRKIRLRDVPPGTAFETCLTRRAGVVLEGSGRGNGVPVDFGNDNFVSLHPDVVVLVAG